MGKKSPVEIVEKIFNVLQDKNPHAINEISSKTGLHWYTIKNYLPLIKFIQEQDTVEILTSKNVTIVRMIEK